MINKAGLKIWLPNNDNVIPAEKASILVAIPTSKRHFKSMQTGFPFYSSNASFITFAPKYVKIKNTIKPAYCSTNDFTKFVR